VHDFSNFCVLQPGDPRSPVRHVRSALVSAEGDGRVRVTVEADRYLYKQMRMMDPMRMKIRHLQLWLRRQLCHEKQPWLQQQHGEKQRRRLRRWRQ
jgi:tRNA U38,U39,U40 pseudouridine synthase TruA